MIEPDRPRRRHAVTAVALGVIALVTIAVGAAHDSERPSAMAAPNGILDISTVSARIGDEYRYAAAHLDGYRELRCWCGCEDAFRHRSLADCFVRDDGRWEAHGAGCGVCIAEAILARERIDAGVALDEIAEELDRTYGPDPTLEKART